MIAGVLGSYRRVQKLGGGAMSEVYPHEHQVTSSRRQLYGRHFFEVQV